MHSVRDTYHAYNASSILTMNIYEKNLNTSKYYHEGGSKPEEEEVAVPT
jgi:hypothetical protein